jgi:hypothetical protein
MKHLKHREPSSSDARRQAKIDKSNNDFVLARKMIHPVRENEKNC